MNVSGRYCTNLKTKQNLKERQEKNYWSIKLKPVCKWYVLEKNIFNNKKSNSGRILYKSIDIEKCVEKEDE